MGNEKFVSQFKVFGIEPKPLPGNYTPENYGRWLMRNVQRKTAVSYSDRTDYTGEKKSERKK